MPHGHTTYQGEVESKTCGYFCDINLFLSDFVHLVCSFWSVAFNNTIAFSNIPHLKFYFFKKIRFGFKIEGPSGEKENVMAKYNKLKAILLPPMIYQFCQGLTAIHRYGKRHRILIVKNRCGLYIPKRNIIIGFIMSDAIVKNENVNLQKTFCMFVRCLFY